MRNSTTISCQNKLFPHEQYFNIHLVQSHHLKDVTLFVCFKELVFQFLLLRTKQSRTLKFKQSFIGSLRGVIKNVAPHNTSFVCIVANLTQDMESKVYYSYLNNLILAMSRLSDSIWKAHQAVSPDHSNRQHPISAIYVDFPLFENLTMIHANSKSIYACIICYLK